MFKELFTYTFGWTTECLTKEQQRKAIEAKWAIDDAVFDVRMKLAVMPITQNTKSFIGQYTKPVRNLGVKMKLPELWNKIDMGVKDGIKRFDNSLSK